MTNAPANALTLVPRLRVERIVIACIRGERLCSAANAQGLKFLRLRGSRIPPATAELLEEGYVGAATMRRAGVPSLNDIVAWCTQAHVRNTELHTVRITIPVIVHELRTKEGKLLRTLERNAWSRSSRKYAVEDSSWVWTSRRERRAFDVDVLVLPRSAPITLSWWATREDRVREVEQFISALRTHIERIDPDGKSMEELVKSDVARLVMLAAGGALEGDGWMVHKTEKKTENENETVSETVSETEKKTEKKE
jgi:hypothetical protein